MRKHKWKTNIYKETSLKYKTNGKQMENTNKTISLK